jgi:hypothetical protein
MDPEGLVFYRFFSKYQKSVAHLGRDLDRIVVGNKKKIIFQKFVEFKN